MKRRDFLEGLAISVTMVSTGALLSACDDDDGGGNSDAGTCNVSGASGFTASPHRHELSLSASQITDGAEITLTSTSGSGHSHQVTLTSSDLATLASSCSVTVRTTDVGHIHSWFIEVV